MSKYTDDKREHERINNNCRKYRENHRDEYNAKTRARRRNKINNMTADELAAYRAKRTQEIRAYRARKKALQENNNNND